VRVVILTESFAKQMGYIGNLLPRHLARLGVDVHVITCDLPPYHTLKDFASTYGDFSAKGVAPAGTREAYDGYTLHTLPHQRLAGYVRMRGLAPLLNSLRPDVVQSLAHLGWIPLEAAVLRARFRYALFTGSHTTASVFPLASRKLSLTHPQFLRCYLTRTLPGRLVSTQIEKCYGATVDCADVAVRFFGVPASKIDVCPLGVDTDIFFPVASADDARCRTAARAELGIAEHEVLCMYTGRFAADKNPLLLAEAVAQLRAAGEPFRAVFFGDGVQRDALRACEGAVVRPFVPFEELGGWFRASDIGVWPTQESTSMLDAAACGVPIIVNDRLVALERVEGNGLRYRLNDREDLVRALRDLRDPSRRMRLGAAGARKMAAEFGWAGIARRRLTDYEAAVKGRRAA
jgi:glycosyltransferase involved in cell wall biosynthesis